MGAMTFAEFQATKREVADLNAHGYGSCAETVPGLLYIDMLGIECETAGHQHPVYVLVIGNSERSSERLVTLERELFEFAVSEGYCEATINRSRHPDTPYVASKDYTDGSVRWFVIEERTLHTDGGDVDAPCEFPLDAKTEAEALVEASDWIGALVVNVEQRA